MMIVNFGFGENETKTIESIVEYSHQLQRRIIVEELDDLDKVTYIASRMGLLDKIPTVYTIRTYIHLRKHGAVKDEKVVVYDLKKCLESLLGEVVIATTCKGEMFV